MVARMVVVHLRLRHGAGQRQSQKPKAEVAFGYSVTDAQEAWHHFEGGIGRLSRYLTICDDF